MNSSRRLGWFLASALAPIFSSLALPVNDGSTTNNLTPIFNSSPDSQGGAVVGLQVADCSTNCSLTAVQTGSSAFFALRSAWYATDVAPTGVVYTVRADFAPASVENQKRGGVMGWLSLSASNGIILQVVPEDSLFSDDPKSFRVAWVDFSADNGNDNESLAHLFNTNGTPATSDFTSAWSDLGTNYSATNFATFQLVFSAPTDPDLAALSNATAHVTARVFQGETNGTPIQVSRTIELLTDLPLPSRGNHRIGYYAVWALTIDSGVIGYLDNLAAEGEVGSTTNAPPSVSISRPAGGATFTEPANIPIVVNATDSDGTITRVEFFAGTTLLGTATNSPFDFTWTNVVAGSYSLTARATDDGRGTNTSSPVNVTVNPATGGGPALTIVRAGNSGIDISWLAPGYQLQMATNLSSPTWIDVPNTLMTNRVALTLSGGSAFFRLFQQSAPTEPALTILLSGTSVIVSWPAPGYQLQMATNLSSPTWIDVPNTLMTNRVTLAFSGGSAFFRLFQQSAPTGPPLTIRLSGSSVVVSWPAQVAGYRLQAKPDLNAATWTEVATSNNQVTETTTGAARFYRLSRQ